MADLAGRYIGRYYIVEKLGAGGMAVVYKAYDTRLERDVAFKFIRTEMILPAMLPHLMKRFEREAKALAKFDHPNIVHIHDYGEYTSSESTGPGAPYLVMQYLPGGTLKNMLQEKRLTYLEAARICARLARALDYAHRRGVIHRDIKPANVLISDEGEVKITDFGIAKALESDQQTQITSTGMSVGTPQYMAPEQWRNQVVPQTDVYALGVMFYEMLTGRRPYDADTPGVIHEKMLMDPLPRPRQFVPGLPEAVERIVFKALAKQPKDRYESMVDFALALEGLENIPPEQGEQKIDQISSGDVQPVDSWWRRLPHWVWLLGSGVLSLIILGMIALLVLMLGQGIGNISGKMHLGSTQVSETDGMTLVYIPEGAFEMGSTDGDNDETPVHTVTLDAFWMDRTEVTNAMYRQCVEAGECQAPHNTEYYDDKDFADHPVVTVDWFQAEAYCLWAGRRLPSEAEWEKAARGTDGLTYPWGNDFDCQNTNIDDKYEGCDGYDRTAPVGSFENGASPYGALDMTGNAWEWVQDWYDSNYYRNSPASNPVVLTTRDYRVARGGSWLNNDVDVRAAVRNWFKPSYSNDYLGFRCASTAD